MIDVYDPSTGEVFAQVPQGSAADVDAAVGAAREAFAEGSAWRRLSPADRGRLIHRLAELIERDADALAALEARDNGKPVKFARHVDVASAVRHFEYFAGWPTKIEGA